MVNILISGYYGFDNIGDESILRTLVSSLREHIPDCSLTVLSHNPASTREKYGVEAVERMSPMAILRAVKKCDMLISGGGSLLHIFVVSTFASAGHFAWLLLGKRAKRTDERPMVPYITGAAVLYMVFFRDLLYNGFSIVL